MSDPKVEGNSKAVYAFQDSKWLPWHVKWYSEEFDAWGIDEEWLAIIVDESHKALGGLAILEDVPPERLTFLGEIEK